MIFQVYWAFINFTGTLVQIDSGPSGIVYGVNRFHHIYCRKGITLSKPTGTSWARVPGTLKYVSCGIYGCWGVNIADRKQVGSDIRRLD